MAEVKTKILAAVLLTVLGCSLARGKNMTKCDVMKYLKNLSEHLLEKDNLLAKLACYAELASGLNVSAVKKLDGSSQVTSYGIFQHRNDLLCSDGATPSPNLCNRNCMDFSDADIRDDALCLTEFLAYFEKRGFLVDLDSQEHIKTIFDPRCASALEDFGRSCLS